MRRVERGKIPLSIDTHKSPFIMSLIVCEHSDPIQLYLSLSLPSSTWLGHDPLNCSHLFLAEHHEHNYSFTVISAANMPHPPLAEERGKRGDKSTARERKSLKVKGKWDSERVGDDWFRNTASIWRLKGYSSIKP